MNTSDSETDNEQPIAAWCDDASLHVKLVDGRKIVTPLSWYPSLVGTSHAVRNTLELMYTGIHWPGLDEDLSIEGMLRGWKARDASPPAVAAE